MKAVRLFGVASLVFALLSGCQAMSGKTAGETVDDVSITSSVKAKLAAEKAGTLTRIDVDTNQGVVSLSGVAANAAIKQRAEELARQVKGVRGVRNNLTVQGS